jgi:hypothetical protein
MELIAYDERQGVMPAVKALFGSTGIQHLSRRGLCPCRSATDSEYV